MNNAQAKKVEIMQQRTNTLEVEERSGTVLVSWTNGYSHPLLQETYQAVIGKRGGIKIFAAWGGSIGVFDKKASKLSAKVALIMLNLRGTIALIG
jgi:hypothetical protein